MDYKTGTFPWEKRFSKDELQALVGQVIKMRCYDNAPMHQNMCRVWSVGEAPAGPLWDVTLREDRLTGFVPYGAQPYDWSYMDLVVLLRVEQYNNDRWMLVLHPEHGLLVWRTLFLFPHAVTGEVVTK